MWLSACEKSARILHAFGEKLPESALFSTKYFFWIREAT
ncbi:hypothetical protein P872_14515 [Rhodonellum psychrophilum GCM71 = DSM 17998]|uniref:Uncharacterized protein n=1 Tax=Rhodonellum psychrophilum GCM71 = DSM 17998 TaxID=1123057 RepID=U5BIA7_9BACT|nr:hypothetical protein P872_14515 [Rhodonellum psychrophilum GCM71 = DSM 17998]